MPADAKQASPLFPSLFSTINVDQILTAQQKPYLLLTQMAQLTVDSFQAVVRRQMDLARDVAEQGSTGLRQLTAPGRADAKVTEQANIAKASFDRTLAHVREVSDILIKSQTEASNLLAKSVSDGFSDLKSVFGQQA
jgi:phasin family protein